MPTKAVIECTNCGTVAICTMLWPDQLIKRGLGAERDDYEDIVPVIKSVMDVHCPICDSKEQFPVISAELVPDKFEHYIVKPLEKKTYGKTKKE